MKKSMLTVIAGSLLLAPAVSLACSEPGAKPAIPDPSTAVTAQMVKANNEVKAYVRATEEWLGCAGLSRSKQNAELDALKEFAEEFNVAVRTFKAKNGG